MANDILIRWMSDSTQAVRDMARMERALNQTTSSQERNARRWDTASRVMRTAGIALGTAVVGVGIQSVKAAAKQEQALGGLQAVFKKQTDTMTEWTRGLSDVGISMTDAASYATKFGASLKGAGLSTEQAATQTRRLVELAADLAATFDGPGGVNGAIDAVGAALRGEYDPLEQWGAALTEAQVNAVLAAKGQDKLTGAALAQAKQAARLELIWQKTKDAQGQAAREADTATAAYRRMVAKLENIKADLGKALLPFVSDLADRLADLTAAAEKNPEAVRDWAKGLAALAASLVLLSTASKGVVVIQGVASAISKFPKTLGTATVIAGIAAAIAGLRKVASPEKIANAWNSTLLNADWWSRGLRAFTDWIRSVVPGLRTVGLATAAVTDALGLTSGKYEEVLRTFDNPIKIQAANDQAQRVVDQTQAFLDDLARARPKPIIDAANQRARQAAAEAQRALDNVKQRRKAEIDATNAKAKAEVNAWEAWAAARKAVSMVVDANTQPAQTDVTNLRNWINSLGASINVGATVTRTVRSTGPGASTFAAPTASSGLRLSSGQTVVININGFSGSEDVLARKVTRAVDGASVRYNRRKVGR